MQRYYITDRHGCADIFACIKRAVGDGVDYIQIREKDLPACHLLALTSRAVEIAAVGGTRILVNGRVDVALAAGAHGVHLPSDAVSASVWRRVVPESFLIAVSCHSAEDLLAAKDANFAVFGPVFRTPGKGPAAGLAALERAAAASPVPIFALGGIDERNAEECIAAGAAGIAGIRMFQR